MALSKPAEAGPGAHDCLSDELLVDLMDGRLPSVERERVHLHAAECDACRILLVAVVRGGLAEPEAGAPPEDQTQTVPGPVRPVPPSPPGAPEPAAPWTPPAEFDEFRLERLLGRGGMGVVYLAHDTSLGRPVAVKFIAVPQPRPLVRAHFETEARAIARLQHPNVVTVFRVGAVDGHPYIVSEYIDGQSLSRLHLPLPWRKALTIGAGLARGLAAAHRQGVLHRDLKPSNALFTEDGVVKLLDFGLAEHFDPDAASRPSSARALAGTPRYMAPELFRGAPATPQSDLYSLGLTLYELCTGSLPPREPVHTPTGTEPRAAAPGSGPPSLGPEVDPELAALIRHCLAPDPAERPSSADLLCETLERLVQRHTAAPLAAGNPYRGLAPFEAEHQSLFFGRDADIRAVIERLRRQPLVLVAGDSGIGKSSLCQAGVLARMAAGAPGEGREMTTVTLWPGPRPLQALAAALAPRLGMKEADTFASLTAAPGWLGPALRERYQERHGLLLFIDQLEELITQAEPAQAARFAHLLGELALPSPGVRVLLAVRGDFLTRVSALPGLGDEAERALYILRPMTPAGVRAAIVGPARSQGVGFESEELIQSLVESTARAEGSLPLLQFALAELWEQRNPAHSHITRTALEAMGGVAGALSRHADGVLARQGPEERQAARRLLLRLVTAEGTRRELGEAELLTTRDTAPRAALRALTEGRLVHVHAVGGHARYVIAHDSLIDSWGTLRAWRADDLSHRAVRQRVETASTEWERLARARDALWGQRLIDEARALDPAMLGPREQAFLAASRRALKLRRWRRYAAGLLGLLILAGAYGWPRVQERRKHERFVTQQVEAARQPLEKGRERSRQARDSREGALAQFDGRAAPPRGSAPPAPLNTWSFPEQLWAQALDQREQADRYYVEATEALERALQREPDSGRARGLLAEVLHERLVLAEDFHQQELAAELRGRLERLVEGTAEEAWRERLYAPAELEVVTEPPGALVELGRYETADQGVRRLAQLGSLGKTPVAPTKLPAGSYRLRVTLPGGPPVDVPVLLTRGKPEKLQFPLPGTIPEGHVYIPPGCFLLGSADPEPMRGFLRAAPLHRVCLSEGYFIGRTEVTFGDWLAYLDTLPPEGPARRILEQPRFNGPKALTLRHRPGTGWTFSFHASGDTVLSAREGESIRYPDRGVRQTADWRRLPLSGVSAEDLTGYFYWLDSSKRLPGARLCSEHEWEYAARGADGRVFPHGDRLRPDDANVDTTYGREPLAFGPDMVGSYPDAASPFGLLDMAGNAFELTRPVTSDLGRIVLRGGAWYYDASGAIGANRLAGDPLLRDVNIGLRVCASARPAR